MCPGSTESESSSAGVNSDPGSPASTNDEDVLDVGIAERTSSGISASDVRKILNAPPEQALSGNTHFLFRSLCNRLLKRILNRFQISGIWLQAHFEIIEDRLLVGFGCGDFLELHVAQHDFVAPDRCQALNHVAYRPLAIFVGAVGGE